MKTGSSRIETALEESRAFAERAAAGKIVEAKWTSFDMGKDLPFNSVIWDLLKQTQWEGYPEKYRNWHRRDIRLALRIKTDNGAQGEWVSGVYSGYAFGRIHAEDCQRYTESILPGRNALDREGIWQSLHNARVPMTVLSGVDMALWDLYGKVENQPIHRLIGGDRNRIKVYVSSLNNLGTVEEYCRHALAVKKLGFHAYKIHPYICMNPETREEVPSLRSWVEYDIPVIRAIRDSVGPDYPLMLDNFTTYTYEDAVAVGHVLDELGFHWYESPMPETDNWLNAYIELGREVKTPLCGPETNPGTHLERLKWTDRGAVHINRIDTYFGGLTSCLRLAAHCEKSGVPMDLHGANNTHSALNIIAAVSEDVMEFYEFYDGEPKIFVDQADDLQAGRPLKRVERGHWPYISNPLKDPDEQGYLCVPQGPGLGAQYNWDFICSREVPKSQTA